jgi:hypothetical protein
LAPLLQATDLADISTHPGFDNGGREGTFGNCPPSERIDYILEHPATEACIQPGIVHPARLPLGPGESAFTSVA